MTPFLPLLGGSNHEIWNLKYSFYDFSQLCKESAQSDQGFSKKINNSKIKKKLAIFGHFWPKKEYFWKSVSVTIFYSFFPNLLQRIREILWVFFVPILYSILHFSGALDWQTQNARPGPFQSYDTSRHWIFLIFCEKLGKIK